ncbi:polyprotein [Rhynchospora pubera]|uniref:Polyprotein n=1 Tax=Rhynchospora pubera TaxID=906938 RepID=A0AAV8CDQ0_9POAL|nr:polyprotein [Rhynchospora pubera]
MLEIEYLGHVISHKGIATDPTKIEAMLQWPRPKTVKELRGFLGPTGYYRRFIKDYGSISKPLTDQLRKNAFYWNEHAEKAFCSLKTAMTTALVLAIPNFTKPFVIETDASDKGIGAVLMQEKRPLAYISKSLGFKSQGLSTYEKEFLSLLTAVQKWRHYLVGGKFIIKTDQISLKHLLEQRLTNAMQHKGLCKLLGLDYVIEYKRGCENKVADALSRRVEPDSSASVQLMAVSEIIPDWITEVKQSYIHDAWAIDLLEKLQEGALTGSNYSLQEGVLRYKHRICVGESHQWRDKLLKEMHASSLGGHSGILGTYQRLKSTFYWPHMKQSVHDFVKHCQVCQMAKGEHVSSPGLLQPLPIPAEAWTSISMDFIMGLPRSEGKDVILVIVDGLTKYAHFLSLSHPFKAMDVAQLFLDNVYKLHGLPSNIVSDRDAIFTSKFWKELLLKIRVQLNMSTAYHPQSDGQTERVNQCLETYLRCMALYGYPPPQLPMGTPSKSSVEAVNQVCERQFDVGAWIYLKIQPYRQLSVQGNNNKKLGLKYYGPFQIMEKYGNVAYKLQLPPGSQIISRRLIKKGNVAGVEVLVKWTNTDEDDATWVDYEFLRRRFPQFILEDKENFKKGGVSGTTSVGTEGAIGETQAQEINADHTADPVSK